MGISLTKESKSAVALSLEDKDNGAIWDEATGTWDRPGRVLTKETKSNISLNLEVK